MLFSWSRGGQECPDNWFSMSQSDSQLPEDYFKLLQTSKCFQNTQVMRLWRCLKKGDFCLKKGDFCLIFWPHPLENTEFGLEGPAAGAAGPYYVWLYKLWIIVIQSVSAGEGDVWESRQEWWWKINPIWMAGSLAAVRSPCNPVSLSQSFRCPRVVVQSPVPLSVTMVGGQSLCGTHLINSSI